MPNLFKKLLTSFFVFLVLFSTISVLFQSEVKAQTHWYDPNFNDWYVKTFDPATPVTEMFGERYTAAQVNWVIWSVPSFFINQTVGSEPAACLMKSNISIKDLLNAATLDLKSMVQIAPCIPPIAQRMSQLVDSVKELQADGMSNQPTTLWAALTTRKDLSFTGGVVEKLANFHIITEVKAQTGFGFGALSPVRSLWIVTRNISYSLMIIVIIAMSFMIMFRMKISPQIAITVQSSLVKVISALILITFSYAIAGLLIDLMYVVYGVISIPAAEFLGNTTIAFNFLTSWGFLIIFGSAVFMAVMFMMGMILFGLALAVPTAGFSLLLVFIGIGVCIMILFMAAKVVFTLIKAYAMTLLLIIAAPFHILLGMLVPNFGFGIWMRSYISNLAIFVTTSVLLLLTIIFLDTAMANFLSIDGLLTTTLNPSTNLGWPPLIGGGGFMANFLLLGVSMVIFTIIPKSAELVQSLIKGGQFNYGAALGEALKPVQASVSYHYAKREEYDKLAGGTGRDPVAQALRMLNLIK
ncbi:MAG: hypothetical protein AAB546_00475 [Patescibacteria group bacterium]